MMRIVLGIEYDGSEFYGWQWQTHHRNIQQTLEEALSKIAQHKITVQCAGRTDTGVHALEQIVHFDTTALRDLQAWHRGTNTHLPPDVRVIWAQEAIGDFHARYRAIARYYRYAILNRATPSAWKINVVRTPIRCTENARSRANFSRSSRFHLFSSARLSIQKPMPTYVFH